MIIFQTLRMCGSTLDIEVMETDINYEGAENNLIDMMALLDEAGAVVCISPDGTFIADGESWWIIPVSVGNGVAIA